MKHLYIPIAHRLGLYIIKAEFEERVMRYEFPEIFHEISEKNCRIQSQTGCVDAGIYSAHSARVDSTAV